VEWVVHGVHYYYYDDKWSGWVSDTKYGTVQISAAVKLSRLWNVSTAL